jgi:deoxyribose-phosphate aldolase
LTLKVVLETGERGADAAVLQACRIALDGGADFLKTSTGRARVNATPQAARLLLQAIAQGGHQHVGFKAAGGIRSVADAGVDIDIDLTCKMIGDVTARRFRIGAGALPNDIEAVLGGHTAPASADATS